MIGTEIKVIERLNIEVSGKNKIVKYEKDGIVSLDTIPSEIINDQIEEFIPSVKIFWNFGILK